MGITQREEQLFGAPLANNKQGNADGGIEISDFMVQVQAFHKAYGDKIKVLISQPTVGMIDYKCHESCWDLAFELKDYETRSNYKFFKTCVGRFMVQYARERFCEYALQYGFDLVFFIDDDHFYPRNIFERLQKHIEKYDIVAPLCFQRDEPYYPVMWRGKLIYNEQGGRSQDLEFIKDFKVGDLIEPDAIGFGCCILKVDMLKKMKRPWFFSMDSVGEDILFSLKAKEKGFKVIVDTSVEAPHLEEGRFVDSRKYEWYKQSHPGN